MYDWSVAACRGGRHKKVCIRYVIIRISQKIIITFGLAKWGVGNGCGLVGGWGAPGVYRVKGSGCRLVSSPTQVSVV